MEFHHVGQPGLELLTLGDPPALASQSTGIIGVSHCAWTVHPIIISFLHMSKPKHNLLPKVEPRQAGSRDCSLFFVFESLPVS